MADIIIDPPVTPFSPPDEIEAWIERLESMKDEEQDAGVLARIDAALDEARLWLREA